MLYVPCFNNWLEEQVDNCGKYFVANRFRYNVSISIFVTDVLSSCIICMLANLLTKLTVGTEPQSLEEVSNEVMSGSKLIQRGRQEDVHELMLLLLNKINDVNVKRFVDWELFTAQTLKTSAIKVMFETTIRIGLHCTVCGQARDNEDDVLNLNLPRATTFHEALLHYFEPELLEVLCENCKSNTKWIKTTKIVKSASVLCVLVSFNRI